MPFKGLLSEYPKNFLKSMALFLFSVLLALLFPSRHRLIAALAMLLSSLGDMALMDFRKFFSRHTPSPFIVGGLLFSLSHVLYALAYLSLSRETGAFSAAGAWSAALIGLLAILSLIALSIRRRRFSLVKALLTALYAAFETLDCVLVFGCVFGLMGLSGPPLWRLAGVPGVLSFLVSDYFIGLEKTAGDASFSACVWPLYTLGQFLLLIAA